MSLSKLADEFLFASKQLNLLVRPIIKIVNPIPANLIPKLNRLTLGKGSGSNMDEILSVIKDKDYGWERYTAILAVKDKDILGWALVRPNYGGVKLVVDIFVNPKIRQSGVGSLLRHEADVYAREHKINESEQDHFATYRNNDIREESESDIFDDDKQMSLFDS